MMIELLRPLGLDLGRRWLAALLLVDESDREALVAEVERRVTGRYAAGDSDRPVEVAAIEPPEDEPLEVRVVHPPVQREGYVEQVHTTYRAGPTSSGESAAGEGSKPRGRGASGGTSGGAAGGSAG